MVLEELLDLVEGDNILPVIKVGVDSSGEDQQLLIGGIGAILHHIGVGVLTEVAGVGLLTVDHQHSAADLAAVAQDGHVKEGQGGGGVPPVIGIEGPLGIASFGLVVVIALTNLNLFAPLQQERISLLLDRATKASGALLAWWNTPKKILEKLLSA